MSANKPGIRATQRNALQRLDQMESDFGSLTQGIQRVFEQLDRRVVALAEIAQALVDLFGAEQVNTKIGEIREANAAEAAEKAKGALAKALGDGTFAVAETVTEESLLTGAEYNKEGEIVKPGYVQLLYSAIKPEFQEKVLGQKVGVKFEIETGTFEVTGIYNPTPKAKELEQPTAQA